MKLKKAHKLWKNGVDNNRLTHNYQHPRCPQCHATFGHGMPCAATEGDLLEAAIDEVRTWPRWFQVIYIEALNDGEADDEAERH